MGGKVGLHLALDHSTRTGPDLLQAGPLFRKNVGPLIYEYPVTPLDCLHPTLSGPTRTVVIINKIFCPFVGAPVRPNMLNMPKSASAHELDSVSSCGLRLMRVLYQVVGFGRGDGCHSSRHRRRQRRVISERCVATSATTSSNECEN